MRKGRTRSQAPPQAQHKFAQCRTLALLRITQAEFGAHRWPPRILKGAGRASETLHELCAKDAPECTPPSQSLEAAKHPE
jgi:hypothetical protein